MYFFTPETIVQANKNIEAIDPKIGGILCILHCLSENIEENISYTIDGQKLRKQLSMVFDKELKDSFDNAKPSYIIFAKNWISTFFNNHIKNKIDLLSCAVFFLRRQAFESELNKEEIIDIFVKRYNLKILKDTWFSDNVNLELVYNQDNVEDNQSYFYSKMGYTSDFKSILFNDKIKKAATEIKAAGQMQPLYSASGVQTCFLLSDEPLDQYYIMRKLNQKLEEDEDIFSGFESWLTSYDNPDYTGKQKYAGYAKMLPKLINYMYENNLIEDEDLNDKNLNKYNGWLDVYNSSIEVKEYDKKKLGNQGGVASLKKYISYIKYLLTRYTKEFDYSELKGFSTNKIFFGVPGCGKSYHIENEILGKEKGTEKYKNYAAVIRTTFYQDYSNTDFVGQILPKISKDENGKDIVEYIFNPGPFTLALIQAISNPSKKVALIVEEINRGNAPAIFGDIFQLLDRDENSVSEYGIVNVGIIDYLNSYEFKVDDKKIKYHFNEIKIPGNLDIFATMNTSDQNVYTLDTAFTRRWSKERIPNEFNNHPIEKMFVPGMSGYTWGKFVDIVNNHIKDNLESLQVNEDKQVGAFFIKERDLLTKIEIISEEKIKAFAYKVLEYLWDDVSKLDHSIIFNPSFKTFEELVKSYVTNGVAVFNDKIKSELSNEAHA